MDLSQFSDADLQALASGDLTKVSDAGLTALHGAAIAQAPLSPQTAANASYQYNPTNSADYDPAHPVTQELSNIGTKLASAAGETYSHAGLSLQQMYNSIMGNPNAGVDAQVAEHRRLDAPLNATMSGKFGQALPLVPLSFVPGLNTYAGAALTGAGAGALQPTLGNESRLENAGGGALLGMGGKFAGDAISNWAAGRAAQPFWGWTRGSADAALAEKIGSNGLRGSALGIRGAELGATFQAGRNAATSVNLSSTPAAIDQISSGLNPSAQALLESNPNVADLMSHATGNGSTNGQMLGRISTGLRQDAYTALNSEGGNREVGLALGNLREHVEDLIQSNISDPTLSAAYAAARPQYGLLQDARYNPSLVNASTGRANMEAWGKFLQRNNPAYTAPGAAEDPLFSAAMWGQAGGGAKGIPKASLAEPWAIPFYAGTHNPIVRGAGGLLSRGANSSLMAPIVPQGLQGLAIGSTPVAVSYLEQ